MHSGGAIQLGRTDLACAENFTVDLSDAAVLFFLHTLAQGVSARVIGILDSGAALIEAGIETIHADLVLAGKVVGLLLDALGIGFLRALDLTGGAAVGGVA